MAKCHEEEERLEIYKKLDLDSEDTADTEVSGEKLIEMEGVVMGLKN
jgi:hypothetical protein